MFFFKSATEKSAAEVVEPVGKFVYPECTDFASVRELERQRSKWSKFLESRPNVWTEEWLWSNRKRKAEKDGPLKKKIMLLFSTKVKLRKQMKKLIRGGVPPELRGQVWWACSGAEKRMTTAQNEEKFSYLVSQLHALHKTQMAADIEKDLLRTFPERIQNDDTEFVDKLRRVLLAYALRNPKIGYCQSMNYICALLLFHMEEERAFWLFTTLVEEILPKDYYTPSLLGGRVDQQVFQSCIAWKLPKVYEVFRATNTLLEPIICPWFLCLYINVLPLYTVCRVWDCLFWEGNIVLFRIGLTLMTSKAPQIVQSEDFISIYTVLKSSNNKEYSFELESPETNINNLTSTNSLFMPSIGGGPSPTASSYTEEPQSPGGHQVMSDTEFLIHSSFGYRWLKSIPTTQVESLRVKFFELLTEENNKTTTPRATKDDSRHRSNGSDEKDTTAGDNASPDKNARNPRHRGSVLMMKLLEEVDAKTLHEIALQMDEGLGDHVQALAKELENSSANDTNTSGALITVDGDESQLLGEDDEDDEDDDDQ